MVSLAQQMHELYNDLPTFSVFCDVQNSQKFMFTKFKES